MHAKGSTTQAPAAYIPKATNNDKEAIAKNQIPSWRGDKAQLRRITHS
jgi:hypothetical protein